MKKILGLIAMLVVFASMAYAATVDLKVGGSTALSSVDGTPIVYKVNVNAATTPFSTGDTVELMTIPAGYKVSALSYISKIAAANANYTMDVGIKGGTLDLLLANMPMNVTASTIKYGDGAVGTTSVFIPFYSGAEAKVLQISDVVGGAVSTFSGTFVIELVNCNK